MITVVINAPNELIIKIYNVEKLKKTATKCVFNLCAII